MTRWVESVSCADELSGLLPFQFTLVLHLATNFHYGLDLGAHCFFHPALNCAAVTT